MTIQHSPLPWSVDPENLAGVLTEDRLDTPWAIAHCAGFAPQDLNGIGNAAFIVRACNAHYQMLEALKVAQSALAMLTDPEAIKTNRAQVAWATAVEAELAARNAIAAAEAEAR